MEYMGNSNWWNDRFKNRNLTIMKHEQLLEEDRKYFPQVGHVLDIACGDGRNSIYLSKQGYEVDAIDFSEEAILRLQFFMKHEQAQIHTAILDLTIAKSFDQLGVYDFIIINHYRVNKAIYETLLKHLKKGGVIWINGFRECPQDNPNITYNDLLQDEDFEVFQPNQLVDKLTYEQGDRKFVRYIWKK